MTMTVREIFQATIAHEPHNEFLFYGSFVPPLEETVRKALNIAPEVMLGDYFKMRCQSSLGLAAPEGYSAPDYMPWYADMEIPQGSRIDTLGVLHTPGSMYHFTHRVSPLRNATRFEELEAFPIETFEHYSDAHMADEVKKIHAAGGYAEAWVGHLYENAWQVRGYEEFLMDMHANPEWCDYIFDKMVERNMRAVTAAARAGVDVIRTGDDVATQRSMMFSKDMWWSFIGRRWAQIYAAARAIKPDIQIWYHSDGDISDIIDKLIDIGVTILNPVQPECLDVLEVKRQYGDKLVLDGTIGTQTTMPFGTADEVRQVVRQRKASFADTGALILSPTHVLEPEVPVDNIVAFFDEAAKPLA